MFCACVCMDVSKRFCVAGRTVFICSPPGVASLKGGTVVSLLGCISLFILFVA